MAINKKDYSVYGPFKLWTIENFPFIEADFDAITNYQLYCKIVEQMRKLCDNQNKLQQSQNDVIDAFNNLENYVNNYFANLDVQEEINNKLDDMAESGQLAEIIAQYLQIASVLGYDTISDMSDAENIIEGSICYTLGQSTYNDGKGGFYKVRTKTESDVIDGLNIVALDVSDSLIAERMPNYYINEINEDISDINNDITDINNDITELQINKNINPKLVKNDKAYFSNLDITGDIGGLSYENFYRINNSTLSIQGVAINKITGELLYNNGTEIYKLTNTDVPTKTVLYSGDYGHGGDCCIYENKMYISDSANNKIHVVDLSNGSKVSYTLDTTKLLNADHDTYTVSIGGICMDNTDDYCYILIQDNENNDHTIKTGSTIRVYKYDFNTTYTKLFEKTQETCYIQGFTKDDEYFYYVGNKPFTTDYTGNKLFIIDNFTHETYDVFENNIDYEYEGLDYGFLKGCEGLITPCCKYNGNMFFGLYAFGGNVTESITFQDTTNEKAYSVKSRGGIVTTYITLYGTFEQDETYEYANFFVNNYPIKIGAGGDHSGVFATSYVGSTRNSLGHAEWDFINKKLIVRPLSTTTTSTSLKLTFVYVTD